MKKFKMKWELFVLMFGLLFVAAILTMIVVSDGADKANSLLFYTPIINFLNLCAKITAGYILFDLIKAALSRDKDKDK